MRQRANSRVAAPTIDRPPCTDVGVVEGAPLQVDSHVFQPPYTPGHTDGYFSYVLALPYPKFIDHAVSGNCLCGVCPDDLPQQVKPYCERNGDSPQG